MNWLGMVAAIVFSMILGFIWFNPKTPMGRVWVRGQGLDPANMPKPPSKEMAQSMIIMVVGSILTWFVFAHTFAVYQDADRNAATGGDPTYDLKVMDGLMGGFFTWLGFFLPLNLGAVAWDRKPWSFALVTTAYYLVTLLVGGLLLVLIG
jgi:hypothetical protein